MAEYSSLKVPELKKLLADKKLPQTGNKADLIARLHDADKNARASATGKSLAHWTHASLIDSRWQLPPLWIKKTISTTPTMMKSFP